VLERLKSIFRWRGSEVDYPGADAKTGDDDRS
jgi:hypothetical protein